MARPWAFQFRKGGGGESQAGGAAQIGRISYILLFIGVSACRSIDSITAIDIPRQQALKRVRYFGRCRKILPLFGPQSADTP
jgi:hypothetical protein